MADLRALQQLTDAGPGRGFVVRLRGLPFSATPRDVLAFLSGARQPLASCSRLHVPPV